MRGWLAITLAASAVLTLSACNRAEEPAEKPAEKQTVETPKRQPGLWKQTMSIEGMPVSQSADICLDEQTDKEIAWWSQQGARSNCAKNDVTQNPDGTWSFASTCDMEGGMRTTTTGTAMGDFKTNYKLRAESTTIGATIPQMNGTHVVNIEAQWLGVCPSDMKPGDLRLPDGRKMNLLSLGKDPVSQP